MSEASFPPPRPPDDARPIDLDANLRELGLRLRTRVAWEYLDAAQEALAIWGDPAAPPRDGEAVAYGFTVFFTREAEPGTFLITAPDFRGDALNERTDDLTESLWIHRAQTELAERTGLPLVPARIDQVIDISDHALGRLPVPGSRFTLLRRSEPAQAPSGTWHSGWVLLATGEPTTTPTATIRLADAVRAVPTLATVLALPPGSVITVDGETVRSVGRLADPDDGRPAQTLLSWGPGPREEVTLSAHGIEFVTEVDPGYRAEALEILGVVNQRTAAEFVDNLSINYGFVFLVFRTEGERRMRMKTLDVSVPGADATTPDLTWAAALRRRQLQLWRALDKPTWTDLNGCMVTMRVHPGALDLPRITLRREQPNGEDTGWVIGTGAGEPEPMAAHAVRFQAPELAACFQLPPGFEVTWLNGRPERVVDPTGAVLLSSR